MIEQKTRALHTPALTSSVPLRWVVYINICIKLALIVFPKFTLLLARLWVNIIANLVSGLMGGWRLWGADTGRADTDWHWPAKNWRSKIQENLNPRLIQSGLKFCWKDKSYFPSPSLTRIRNGSPSQFSSFFVKLWELFSFVKWWWHSVLFYGKRKS